MANLALRNQLTLRNRGPELQNRIVACAGRKGSGKSTLVREILHHADRLFVFDTMGEHLWIPDILTSLDEAWLYILERGTGDENFKGSYISEDPQDETLENDFVEICRAVFETGNVSFCVEELPMMSNPNYVPGAFDSIVRLGRHRSINVIYTAQRLSECPRRVTAATDVFILFHTSEPIDLDKIAERAGNETAALVQSLHDHEFVVYDAKARTLMRVDSQWYDSLLNVEQEWTPAVGRNGRKLLWSMNDGR